MLANWVKQSTTTTGTGTITLDGTPPAGFIKFSDAFIDGQTVQYTIEDGNNREIGFGELASGANWTLTRQFVLEKLDGGVFSQATGNTPLTGISLSGSAVVTAAASAVNALGSPLDLVDTVVDRHGYVYPLLPCKQSAYMTSDTVGADTVYLQPYFFATSASVTKAVIDIETAGGTKARVGVYAPVSTGSGRAGKLIAETGDIDTSTTGIKESTLSNTIQIRPGFLWIGLLFDGAPVVKTWDVPCVPMLVNASGSSAFPRSWTAVSTSAGWTAMPADLTSVLYGVHDGNEHFFVVFR